MNNDNNNVFILFWCSNIGDKISHNITSMAALTSSRESLVFPEPALCMILWICRRLETITNTIIHKGNIIHKKIPHFFHRGKKCPYFPSITTKSHWNQPFSKPHPLSQTHRNTDMNRDGREREHEYEHEHEREHEYEHERKCRYRLLYVLTWRERTDWRRPCAKSQSWSLLKP